MQVLCQLSYSPGRGDYSDRPRSVAKVSGCGGRPEEDERPEEDGQEGGEDQLDDPDGDVVVREGDVDPHQDVDEAEEAESAEHGCSFTPLRKTAG